MLHYQRGLPARASVTMVSTQDHVQSQSLFNIKDSNKVSNHRAMRHLLVVHFKKNTSGCALASYKSAFQEERERRVLVRKFKFEEPRREQIDELKVCIVLKGTAQTLLHLSPVIFLWTVPVECLSAGIFLVRIVASSKMLLKSQ